MRTPDTQEESVAERRVKNTKTTALSPETAVATAGKTKKERHPSTQAHTTARQSEVPA